MRFLLDAEQQAFAHSLDAMLTAADTPSAVRAWGSGDFRPGQALWGRLAEAGVLALAVPEEYGGMGPLPVELAVAFVELGRHAVPGPLVETVAAARLLTALGDDAAPSRAAKERLGDLASGEATATLALPEGGPYALDPEAASWTVRYAAGAGSAATELRLAPGHGPVRRSADPARRLALPVPGGPVLAAGPRAADAARAAADWAVLATAAQALGVGLALLDRTVAHVRQRTQFGVAVGSFQAVKHQLADTLMSLEFARPLLFGAALSMTRADIAAAKVAASEAAYRAARTALQLHGAVGYTQELDLSLWLRKAQALRTAWGAPGWCREQVLFRKESA
ncbi:acyl-CoA dehydrogenase family protein [Streptomyces sp. NPDC002851]